MTTAVVLGGGFAGVLAAAVLARHVDDVTLVERGWYPPGAQPRPGLPQAHHNHVLIADGARALEALFPGVIDDLLAAGAHRRGLTGEALILSAAGWFRRYETGAWLVSCSRWLSDDVVRKHALGGGALAGGTVRVRDRTRVVGLTGDASRVSGVRVRRDDGSARTIRADLVVDATGRWSAASRWLAELGGPAVEEISTESGMAYSTRIYRAPAGLAATIPAIMIHPSPLDRRPGRGATLFPIEGGRWIVTLTGTGEPPPRDTLGFAEYAGSLRSPVVAELMAAARPAGCVRPFRATANIRRFFERAPLPAGFLVVGDALAAVNPVFSHGMSVAALSALRLDAELSHPAATLTHHLQAAIAQEAERSWELATSTTGMRLTRATVSSPELITEFFRAQALTHPGLSVPGGSRVA